MIASLESAKVAPKPKPDTFKWRFIRPLMTPPGWIAEMLTGALVGYAVYGWWGMAIGLWVVCSAIIVALFSIAKVEDE